MLAANLPWYVARSSGLVGWTLLTASVLWGLALSTRTTLGSRRPKPSWMLDLHRYLGGLGTLFTVLHVAAIVGDSYLHFGIASVLVPFASEWRPVAVAWGVVALYLLGAVELTSLARRQLPRRLWRLTHFASLPLFVLATLHAVTVGTDTRSFVFIAVASTAVVAVAALTTRRIQQAGDPRPTAARIRVSA